MLSRYYQIIPKFTYPTSSHHAYGYATEPEFVAALLAIHERYAGKVGRLIRRRKLFLHLRFDTGQKVWVPCFLTRPVPPQSSRHRSNHEDPNTPPLPDIVFDW